MQDTFILQHSSQTMYPPHLSKIKYNIKKKENLILRIQTVFIYLIYLK